MTHGLSAHQQRSRTHEPPATTITTPIRPVTLCCPLARRRSGRINRCSLRHTCPPNPHSAR